jgi:tetratricopeptide (TPR) repeat protein
VNSVSFFAMPTADGCFIGREKEIARLLRWLEPANGKAVVAIIGESGIGKTTTAVQLAHRLREDYPSQFFIDASSLAPIDLLAQIIREKLGATEPLPLTQTGIRRTFEYVFADTRTLFVLDNADHESTQLFAPPKNCALIATSRQPLKLPMAQLYPLQIDESVALLKHNIEIDGVLLKALALQSGNLPFALKLFGAIAKNKIVAPLELERSLETELARLNKMRVAPNAARIEAPLALIYHHMSVTTQQAARALSVLRFSFDRACANTITTDMNGTFLSECVRLGLIEHDRVTDRYCWHETARGFTFARLAENERTAANLRHAEHFTRRARRAASLMMRGDHDIGALRIFDYDRTHIEQAFAFLETHIHEPTNKIPRRLVDLVDGAFPFLPIRFRPQRARAWLQSQIDAHRAQDDRLSEARATQRLASWLFAQDETRSAAERYEQAALRWREMGDARCEANALERLFTIHAANGEADRAIQHGERALTLHRKFGNPRAEKTLLNALGLQFSKSNQMHRAIECFEEALSINVELGEPRGEAIEFNRLGAAYAAMQNWSRAIELHTRALNTIRGEQDKHGEATTMRQLASAYRAMGQSRRAATLLEDALAIARTLDDFGLQIALMRDLSGVCLSVGANARAIELMEDVTNRCATQADAREEAANAMLLGDAYAKSKLLKRAIECWQRSLKLSRESSDRDTQAAALERLGETLFELGDETRAYMFMIQAKGLKPPVLPEPQPFEAAPPLITRVVQTMKFAFRNPNP